MIGDAPAITRRPWPMGPCSFRQSGRGRIQLEALVGRGLNRFFDGTFAGKYQDELLAEFDRYLPEQPPWKSK